MLVLNVWEGQDKWHLAFAKNKIHGHAAMTIPPQNPKLDDQPSTYISWWPDGDDTVESKGGHVKSEERAKDRSFAEDLWAENQSRYLSTEIFTLAHSSIPFLKAAISTFADAERGEPHPVSGSVAGFWKGKGHELSDEGVFVGRVPGGGQWIVHDTKAKKSYLCFKGTELLKVQEFDLGNRPLFQHEMHEEDGWKALAFLKDKEPWDKEKLPASIRTVVEGKGYPLTQDAVIQKMSGHQFMIKTKDKDTYFWIERTETKAYWHFHQWTRAYKAPTTNIEIPTITADGRGLDDVAILRWWKVFNGQTAPQWHTFERNCSVIVNLALRVGGAARFAAPHIDAPFLCWTPNDIKQYGQAIVKGLGSKRPKPRMPMEGGLTDWDFEGFDFKKQSCVWHRDTWEKLSKLKTPDIRSGPLKDIDKTVEDYHKLDVGNAKARAAKLGELVDKISDFTASKPDSKRAAAVFDLAERAVLERTKLLA
jgi:hypothetical protein